MVQFKGTKGKWEQETVYPTLFTEVFTKEKRIAEVKHYEKNPSMEKEDPSFFEGKANALLISKAPEMFDFINRISGEMLRNDFVLDEKWYEQAKQLLTEATKID